MDDNQRKTIDSYNKTAKDFADRIGRLGNYDDTYDFLVSKIRPGSDVLDLACGPGQISLYITQKIDAAITGVDLSREMLRIAAEHIPGGVFVESSMVDYKTDKRFDAVILGFGIPYLKKDEVKQCLGNSINLLKSGSHIYISFMEGDREGFEKTSFGGRNDFYIHYHRKADVIKILNDNGVTVTREFVLDYTEPNGDITKDIILIGVKNK